MESTALIKKVRTLVNRIGYVEAEVAEGDISGSYAENMRKENQEAIVQIAHDIENPGLKAIRDLIRVGNDHGYEVTHITDRVRQLKQKG